MKKTPYPPDFKNGEWDLKYCTDSLRDPVNETNVHIRLVDPIPRVKKLLRKKLARFWYATSYKYLKGDGTAGGLVIRPYNGDERIKMWGLPGDEDNWLRAVFTDGEWRILKKHEELAFDFRLSPMQDHIQTLELWLGNRLLETW